jgi:hypothetical protein
MRTAAGYGESLRKAGWKRQRHLRGNRNGAHFQGLADH